MPYVALGIIILVASFVIALISLVYEQKKVEERKTEEEAQDSVVEAGSGVEALTIPDLEGGTRGHYFGDTNNPNASGQGSVVESVNSGSTGLIPGDGGVAQRDDSAQGLGTFESAIDEEQVWWNTLVAGSSGTGNTLVDSEEQKSIRAIQAELARLTSAKTRGGGVNAADEHEDEVGRHETKRRNFLVGEFSLSDMKRSS